MSVRNRIELHSDETHVSQKPDRTSVEVRHMSVRNQIELHSDETRQQKTRPNFS
jgi:hypothetical protein